VLPIDQALTNMGDRQLNKMLDPAITSLARLTSGGSLGALERVELAVKLHSRVGMLRNKDFRTAITDSLRKGQAESLCRFMEVEFNDPWQTLRGIRIAKNTKREEALFEWFRIPPEEIPDDVKPDPPPTTNPVMGSHALFKHQRTAVRRIREILDSEQPRAFLHMPTGSGKTRTAMNLVCQELSQEEPRLVVWLAFNGELCEQAAQEFQRAWSHHGNREVELQRMWGSHDIGEVTDDGVLFVGLDKLWAQIRRDNTWVANLSHRVHMMVFDEAHQSTAETYKLMVETVLLNDDCKLLGLSATPGRTYSDMDKDEELSELYFKQKVSLEVEGYDSPIDFLVGEGYLSDPDFHQMTPPGEPLSDSDLERVYGKDDYDEKLLDSLTDSEERNMLILDKARELIAEGHRRIIVFATSMRHSDILSSFMEMKWGTRCASITSKTLPEARKKWIDAFLDKEDEEPCILFNYGVLTTGFDAPKTSAAIIARPTKSLVLYSQMVGRVIRGSEVGGTDEAEIWTVVDQQLPGFRDLSEAFWNWEDVW